jgi:hypothetical protein
MTFTGPNVLYYSTLLIICVDYLYMTKGMTFFMQIQTHMN